MAVRVMTGKRLPNGTPFTHRKVAPIAPNISIHSSEVDDQKVCNCIKVQK